MRVAKQGKTHPCACRKKAMVCATSSPFEFEWRCTCGRRGVISWAHDKPAPAFSGDELTYTDGVNVRRCTFCQAPIVRVEGQPMCKCPGVTPTPVLAETGETPVQGEATDAAACSHPAVPEPVTIDGKLYCGTCGELYAVTVPADAPGPTGPDPQLTKAEHVVAEAARLLGPDAGDDGDDVPVMRAKLHAIDSHYKLVEDARARLERDAERHKKSKKLYDEAVDELLAICAPADVAELPLFDDGNTRAAAPAPDRMSLVDEPPVGTPGALVDAEALPTLDQHAEAAATGEGMPDAPAAPDPAVFE